MILDLIAILFVIILSFCLCMNENIKNTITNCQISHILVGLSVIVFYKLAKYFKIKDKGNKFNNNNNNNDNTTNIKSSTESFADTTSMSQDINDFISGANNSILSTNQLSNLTTDQLTGYTTQLSDIASKISQLQSAIVSPPPSTSTDTSNIPSLDIAAQQQYQQFQINYLNKQIKNSQDILNAQSVANSSTNYKPIKVFSSCVIANADGSTTVEKPVVNNTSSDSSSISAFSDTIANNIINNTISQSNFEDRSPLLNLSTKTGMFNNIISTYLHQ
jgi:hypothetical protein